MNILIHVGEKNFETDPKCRRVEFGPSDTRTDKKRDSSCYRQPFPLRKGPSFSVTAFETQRRSMEQQVLLAQRADRRLVLEQ